MSIVSFGLSGIALIISVLSPAIVAFLNNRHEKEMYKLRHYDELADNTISEFVEVLGLFASDSMKTADFKTLFRITGKMYIYTPKNQWKYLDSVSNYAMTKQGYERVEAGYYDFCKSIAKWNSQM